MKKVQITAASIEMRIKDAMAEIGGAVINLHNAAEHFRVGGEPTAARNCDTIADNLERDLTIFRTQWNLRKKIEG